MKRLKIYFTSDVHGYIFPTDYRDKDFNNRGFLQLSHEFKKDGNTLIIDGGDTIQGCPFASFISTKNYDVHPYCSVINNAKYDYVVLGNHDFNYGYDYLMSYIKNINAKVLTANVIDKTESNIILPYDIKTLDNGLIVGIIGITTDYINVWEKPQNISNFDVQDTYQAVKKYITKIKSCCDVLIGVYHGGFENDLESGKKLSDTSENIAYKLCQDFDFDLLLTGHQHFEIVNKKINNTYIAQTPGNGTKYVEIDVSFENKNITKINGSIKAPKKEYHSKVSNQLIELDKEVQHWLDSPVGHLRKPLLPSSHLDMAVNGSELANFFNQVQLHYSNADISCTAFANSVKGFNKDVTVRDIVSTYIYPNTLIVKEVTGDILKQALERCASYFEVINGEVTISDRFLKPKIEHYNYDYYSNINYTFNLSKPVGQRVVAIKFNNNPVHSSDKLSLIMNNYRSSGTGGYDFFKDLPIIKDIQIDMTELIIRYFTEHSVVDVDNKKYFSIIKE